MRSPGFSVMGTTMALGCSGRKLSPDSSARSRAWTLASRTASLPHALVRKRSRSSAGVMSSACSKISFSRLDGSAMAIMQIVPVIQQCDAPDGFGPKTSESFLQFLIKPGAGVGPDSLGRAFGNFQQPRRLDIRQTGKETQLDQLGAEWITRRQFLQRLVHRQQMAVVAQDRNVESGHVNALQFAAVFDALFAPGVFDEDAPHRLGCCGEEMTAAVPLLVCPAGETQPRVMHQRRRLQGLAWSFVGHLVRGKFAQFLIDEGEQFLCCFGIALLNGVENASDFAHALEPKRSTGIAEAERLGVMTVRSAGAIPLHNSPRERCYGTISLEALFCMGSHFLLTPSYPAKKIEAV